MRGWVISRIGSTFDKASYFGRSSYDIPCECIEVFSTKQEAAEAINRRMMDYEYYPREVILKPVDRKKLFSIFKPRKLFRRINGRLDD